MDIKLSPQTLFMGGEANTFGGLLAEKLMLFNNLSIEWHGQNSLGLATQNK